MDDLTRRRLILGAARYNFYLILIGACIRPIILPTPWYYLLTMALAVAIYGLVYYLILSERVYKLAGFLLFGSAYACLVPFLISTGGIHSHLIYVFPLAPMYACLVLSERGSLIVMVLTVVTIISLGLTVPEPGAAISIQATLPKVIWLCLAVFVGSAFIRLFMSENRALADALKHQAQIDYLTGILNRRGVEIEIEREFTLAKACDQSMAIFMVDLDQFKRYNDMNGHVEGDVCLKKVSQKLDRLVSVQGGVLGRFGGEEFIVALPGCSDQFAGEFAESLRLSVSSLGVIVKKGQSETLTTSVGYCHREAKNIIDVRQMIARADAKLYACKSAGRNCSIGDLGGLQSVQLEDSPVEARA